MRHHFAYAIAILIVVALGLAALFNSEKAPNDTRPRVAASVFAVHSLVSEIAGDALNVVQLMPSGANPHTFEPTPETIATLANAPVIYSIGLGIDNWATTLSEAETITLFAKINLLQKDDGTIDPHYWLTIPNAKIMAETVAQDLSSRFPEHADDFQTNLDDYLSDLSAAELQIQELMTHVKNNNIVTQHDAWYYFADAYGLNIIGTYEPSSGREPTPQDLAELAQLVEQYKINTFFADAGESEAAVLAFTQDYDLNYVALDAEGTSGLYDSYISLMLGNAKLISQNQ